jgi:hypothetical protein
VEDARAVLDAYPETRRRFDKIAEFGLELLSTVHWVATRGGASAPDAVVKATYEWGDCKRQFSPRQNAHATC